LFRGEALIPSCCVRLRQPQEASANIFEQVKGAGMNTHVQQKSILRNTTSGSLLAAGMIAAVFFTARIDLFGSREAAAIVGGSGRYEASTRPASDEIAVPAPEIRNVVDYLSRKYRVAAPAVEPLVGAARAAGEKVGLDPMLIVAVMAIESGFNPIAESPLGAQGLMQVIPRFHQDKIEDGAGRLALLDPLVNIQVGSRVLKESIRRAGSLEAGLQQYGGAVSDGEALYAARVLAEKQRLDAALRRGRQSGA
jgi:soluble lytic murein transglycosylase-like protein